LALKHWPPFCSPHTRLLGTVQLEGLHELPLARRHDGDAATPRSGRYERSGGCAQTGSGTRCRSVGLFHASVARLLQPVAPFRATAATRLPLGYSTDTHHARYARTSNTRCAAISAQLQALRFEGREGGLVRPVAWRRDRACCLYAVMIGCRDEPPGDGSPLRLVCSLTNSVRRR